MGGLSRLGNLQVLEVSLVKRGANNKRVAMTKEDKEMDPILKTALETECEAEKDLPEIRDANIAEAVNVAVRALKAHELDADTAAAVQKALFGVTETKPEGKGENSMTEMSEEVKAQLEALQKDLTDQKEEREKLEKALADARDAHEMAAFVTKAAAEFTHVPGEPEDVAALLKTAHTAGIGEDLEKVLKAMNDQIKHSELLATKGSPAQETASEGVLKGRIEEIRKGSPELSYEQAYVRVIKSDPELKAQIRKGGE